MKKVPLLITEYQRGNLKKLADYLASLPADYEHLDMRFYYKVEDKKWVDYYFEKEFPDKILNPYPNYFVPSRPSSNRFEESIEACGSTACAVGHSPMAGIPYKAFTSWEQLCSREFGLHTCGENGRYLFSYEWGLVSREAGRCPHHAVARIYCALEEGVPKDSISLIDWDYSAYMPCSK